MTDNEKLVAFATATSLMLEAQERLSDSIELFHKLGAFIDDTEQEAAEAWNRRVDNGNKTDM